MDVLARIYNLRKSHGWSEYQLAQKAGITQSTISTWYRRKITPTIPSIERICNAFDITLSEFFIEHEEYTMQLTKQQIRLLHNFEKLNSEQLEALNNFLEKIS